MMEMNNTYVITAVDALILIRYSYNRRKHHCQFQRGMQLAEDGFESDVKH